MRNKRKIAGVIILIVVLISATSCSFFGKDVTITVNDNGNAVSVDGKDNMTVDEILKKAGITLSARDTVEPELSKRWSDAGAGEVTVKRYAKVTVTDGTYTQQPELVGGTVEQAITQAGFDIKQYETPDNMKSYLTNGMTITLVKHKEPETTAAPTTAQPTTQAPATQSSFNTIKGNDTDGYYYFGSNGEVDYNYCDAVTVDGVDWNVICGVATKVVSESDKTLHLACKDVARWTNSSMSKEDKLKVCFDSIKSDYLEGVRHNPPYREDDWPVVCANDIFVYGKGDCYSYGAAFAYVGRAIGYTESYTTPSGVCTAIKARTSDLAMTIRLMCRTLPQSLTEPNGNAKKFIHKKSPDNCQGKIFAYFTVREAALKPRQFRRKQQSR